MSPSPEPGGQAPDRTWKDVVHQIHGDRVRKRRSRYGITGGGVNAARRLFPEAPEPWMNLSTSIDAVPYAVGVIAPDARSVCLNAAALDALEAGQECLRGIAVGR